LGLTVVGPGFVILQRTSSDVEHAAFAATECTGAAADYGFGLNQSVAIDTMPVLVKDACGLSELDYTEEGIERTVVLSDLLYGRAKEAARREAANNELWHNAVVGYLCPTVIITSAGGVLHYLRKIGED